MLNDFPKQLNSRSIVSAGRSCLLPNKQPPFPLEFFVHPAAHGVKRYSTPRFHRNDKEFLLPMTACRHCLKFKELPCRE